MANQRFFLQTLLALVQLSLPLCLLSQTSSPTSSAPENLIQNGSFEDGTFNITQGGNEDFVGNYSNPDIFPGWNITRGDIERARGRWEPASDCTPTCIDLNGGEPATLITSFRVTLENHAHTLLLDTAANPDASPSPVNGTFTVTVISAQNETIISSDIRVIGQHHDYTSTTIGWHTYALRFMTPLILQGNLTLSFSSNINGWYGPLIDHVRIFQGNFSSNPEQDAGCKKDAPALSPPSLVSKPGKKPRIALILGSLTAVVLVTIVCIGISIWGKRKQRSSRDKEAMSILRSKLRVFPYSVIKSATQNFHPCCKLGEGTFGAVYKGILEDGCEVAIKKLYLRTPQGQAEFLNEAMVISTVQHRNLVLLKGCCAKGQERFLVYEYVENKSLYQVLWESKGDVHLDWPKRFQIALGTARGLAYLHESSQPRIIHRDIKAANILLDRKFEAKIADFGLAKWFPDDKTHISGTHIAGTLGYLAPEYALRGHLSEKADVFSFGVVVLELVSGRKNLDPRRPPENEYILDFARTLWRQGNMKDLIDPEMHADTLYMEEIDRVIRVGLWCTQEAPAMRPTMSEAISVLQGLSGQNEDFNTMQIEAPELPLLWNDSALSFSRSDVSAESSSSTAFSSMN